MYIDCTGRSYGYIIIYTSYNYYDIMMYLIYTRALCNVRCIIEVIEKKALDIFYFICTRLIWIF